MVGTDEVVGRIGEEKAGPRCAAVRSEPVESRFSASAGDALLGTGGKRRLFQIPFGKLAAGGAHAPLVLSLVRYGRHAYDRVVAIGRDYAGSVAQFGRGPPVPHGANAASDLVPEHRHAAVSGAQMLQAVNSDRPLRHLCFVVAGMSLTVFVGIHRDLAGHHLVAIDHQAGLSSLSLKWRNSMNIVLGSSTGTSQRL